MFLLTLDAVLCVGVRINVYDKVGPGYSKTEVKMSTTEKSKSIKETISSVFGSPFLSGLCVIRVDLSSIVEKALHGKTEETIIQNNKQLWRIEGMVSNAPNNQRAVAREIQFFSMNGRPVDLPKISKALAAIWRNFESADGSKKRPACILGVYLPNSMFDVNVTPDKREVFIQNENEIYSLLQAELYKTWAMQTEGTFATNAVETKNNNCIIDAYESPHNLVLLDEDQQRSLEKAVNEAIIAGDNAKPSQRRMKRRNAFVRSFDQTGTATTDDHIGDDEKLRFQSHQKPDPYITLNQPNSMISSRQELFEFQVRASKKVRRDSNSTEQRLWQQTKLSFSSPGSKGQAEDINELKIMQSRVSSAPLIRKIVLEESQQSTTSFESIELGSSARNITQQVSSPIQNNTKTNSAEVQESDAQSKTVPQGVNSPIDDQMSVETIETKEVRSTKQISTNHHGSKQSSLTSAHVQTSQLSHDIQSPSPSMMKVTPNSLEDTVSPSSLASQEENEQEAQQEDQADEVIWEDFQNTADVIAKAEAAHIEIMNRRKFLKQMKSSRFMNGHNNHDDNDISSSNDNGNNIVKLSKDDFLTMTVIGQFNHGFILALCDKGHLWILDQHACDEKYNFEKLCKETKILEQKLLKPLPLELSPSEENCILENMDIFERNGFRFEYDDSKSPRNRLSLIALPHSGSGGDGRKAVQFGKEDVGALCAILGADGASSNGVSGSGTGADGNGSMGNNAVRRHAGVGHGEIVRLPKAIAMFASRACRSSIMIGDALSQKKMEEVVKRLCSMDQPWTCAHGRPTVKHIRDFLDELIQDEKMSSKIVAGDIAALSQVEH